MAPKPASSGTSDRTLMEGVAAGDQRALAILYDRHATTVYSLALSIVGESQEAEEVVADVFLRIWQSPERYDPERGSPSALLVTMARSRSLDRVRARGRRAAAVRRAASAEGGGVAAPLSSPGVPPERGVERREARDAVGGALAELPEAQRRAIELAYFGGLTQSEIATELNEPLGTVKTRIRDGMQKLRAALAPLAALREP